MAFQREAAMKVAEQAMSCESMADMGEYLAGLDVEGDWKKWSKVLALWCRYGGQPPMTIFAKGNSKLPFYAFSTLPLVTCPGKGECAKWCYSLTAWRYPAAFFRQVQNTLLLRFHREKLSDAMFALPLNTTVRLYVDGDFDSMETMRFWFWLCKLRSDLKVYGYSKSWEIFLDFEGDFPKNYVLNISSGSRYSEEMQAKVAKLPCVRGEFLAVKIAGKYAKGFARYSDKTYHAAVRAAGKAAGMPKAFSCPGDCGACTPKGHACGDASFVVPVLIGIH